MEILTKATRLNIQSESMVDDRPEIQLVGEREKNSVTGLLSIMAVSQIPRCLLWVIAYSTIQVPTFDASSSSRKKLCLKVHKRRWLITENKPACHKEVYLHL